MNALLRQRLLAAVGLRQRHADAPAPVSGEEASPAAPPSSALAGGPAEALLRRLEWTVIRRLDGWLHGDCRTLMRGAGLDLADLREYQPHDDVRHIDWNVTARVGTPHVRQFQEDRDMTVVFLLDLSSSVNWGSVAAPGPDGADAGVRTKQQVATELIAVLARLFTRSGHRLSALIYRQDERRTEELPARSGRIQVLQLLTRMATRPATTGAGARPPGAPSRRSWLTGWRQGRARPAEADGEATRLADLLQAAENRLRRRCTVIVVSDFISQPGWQAPLARLALRHEVLAVRLSDPSEHALPAVGLVLMRDAESGEEMLVDTDDPGLRARHAELALAQDNAVRQGLAGAGVDTLELGTAEPLIDTLRRFLDLRRLRRRQGAAGAHGAAAPAAPPFPTPSPETSR